MTSEGTEFRSSWWSIRLQPGWSATENAECVSVRSRSDSGALQISSIRKPSGHVTDDDLLEFSSDSKEKGHGLKPFSAAMQPGFQPSSWFRAVTGESGG